MHSIAPRRFNLFLLGTFAVAALFPRADRDFWRAANQWRWSLWLRKLHVSEAGGCQFSVKLFARFSWMLGCYLSVLVMITGSAILTDGIRPSFYLSDCGWNATDILVVTQTPDRGTFRVTEAIKGNVPVGTALKLDDLTPPEGVTISLRQLAEGADLLGHPFYEGVPPLRSTDRVIVFLLRPDAPPEFKPRADIASESNSG